MGVMTEWEDVPDISEVWSNTSIDEITSGQQEVIPLSESNDNNNDDETVDKKWTRIFHGATDSMRLTIVGTTANQLHDAHTSMAGKINQSDTISTKRAILIQVVSNKEEGVSASMMQHGKVKIYLCILIYLYFCVE